MGMAEAAIAMQHWGRARGGIDLPDRAVRSGAPRAARSTHHEAGRHARQRCIPNPAIPTPIPFPQATPRERRRAILRLLLMILVLGALVVPLLLELPLGSASRMGILAWLLVAVAMYWIYAGLGYRPLLLLQLLLFSMAATLLITKVALVVVDIHRLSVLRRAAAALIMAGAGLALVNLGAMIWALLKQRGTSPPEP
jgi:hypothetical protein